MERFLFKTIDPNDKESMNEVFRFRCEILCDELGYYEKERYENGLETDPFDLYATHYGAYEKGRLVAYVRFIHHSPIGYPATTHLQMPSEVLALPQDQIGEISRIFIHKEYRKLKMTRVILQTFMKEFIYPEAKRLGVRFCLGALQEDFLKLLNRFKIPYRAVTEPQLYGGIRYGALMDLKEYERLWGIETRSERDG